MSSDTKASVAPHGDCCCGHSHAQGGAATETAAKTTTVDSTVAKPAGREPAAKVKAEGSGGSCCH